VRRLPSAFITYTPSAPWNASFRPSAAVLGVNTNIRIVEDVG
jgi:hypothetical protein